MVRPGSPRRYRTRWNWALPGWSPIRCIRPSSPCARTRGENSSTTFPSVPLGNRPNLGCLLQIVDVTVVAGRERILRERQNARYDAVVGGAPDAILTLDAAGVIQLVNPAAAREFGYASDELIGQSMDFLLEDADEWNKAFKGILDGVPISRPIELTARRKNGAPSYLEASASRWASEGRTFVTAILRDVNERRMAVDALRLLNQTLERRVAQSTADRNRMWTLSTDVMMVAGLDGTISSINPAWTHLLGWQEPELLGRQCPGIRRSPTNDRCFDPSSMPCPGERRRSGSSSTCEPATARAAASNGARSRRTISFRRSAATSPPSARRRMPCARRKRRCAIRRKWKRSASSRAASRTTSTTC